MSQIKRVIHRSKTLSNLLSWGKGLLTHKPPQALPTSLLTAYHKAKNWIIRNSNPDGGVIFHSHRTESYPEVTGYLIPTLLKSGLKDLAFSYSLFLYNAQQVNGAWLGADGKETPFDTVQVMKGLLESFNSFPFYTIDNAIHKAFHYITKLIRPNGSFRIRVNYDMDVPPSIMVYCLPTLRKAVRSLQDREAILQTIEYYLETANNHLNPRFLTHFLAYIIDGYIDLKASNLVRPIVKQILKTQRKDGAIPAFKGAKWVCNVGVAQFAIIAFKLGYYEIGARCIEYLRTIQRVSGGFLGSHGAFASYFPASEISWANKFFLDALHLKVLWVSKK